MEYNSLLDFIDNAIIELDIKDKVLAILKEVYNNKDNILKMRSCIDTFNNQINYYFNDQFKNISKLEDIDFKNKKWVIVIGTKYNDRGIIEASRDKETAEIIKKGLEKLGFNIYSIKRDIDVYFNKEMNNLIVIGGNNINKITASIYDHLIIQPIKIRRYDNKRHEYYLVNTDEDYLDETNTDYLWADKKYSYSIQLIKTPHTDTDNPNYMIIVFGLDRNGTTLAGNKLIQMAEGEFKELKNNKWRFLGYAV